MQLRSTFHRLHRAALHPVSAGCCGRPLRGSSRLCQGLWRGRSGRGCSVGERERVRPPCPSFQPKCRHPSGGARHAPNVVRVSKCSSNQKVEWVSKCRHRQAMWGTTQCRKGLEVPPPFRRCKALSAATPQAVRDTSRCRKGLEVPPSDRRCRALPSVVGSRSATTLHVEQGTTLPRHPCGGGSGLLWSGPCSRDGPGPPVSCRRLQRLEPAQGRPRESCQLQPCRRQPAIV